MIVLVLRTDVERLPPDQLELFKAALGGSEASFVRTDPTDADKHREDCADLNAKVVILPKTTPIPELAMQDGVRHVILTDKGPMELVRIETEFKPFVL